MHGSIARLWTDYRLAKSTFEDKIKRAHHDLSPSSNLYAPMINPVARRRHANHNNEGLAWAKDMAQRTGCDTLELGNIGFCICFNLEFIYTKFCNCDDKLDDESISS